MTGIRVLVVGLGADSMARRLSGLFAATALLAGVPAPQVITGPLEARSENLHRNIELVIPGRERERRASDIAAIPLPSLEDAFVPVRDLVETTTFARAQNWRTPNRLEDRRARCYDRHNRHF